MKLVYFAAIRERLGRAEEEVSPPADILTIADLIDWLRGRDEATELALARPASIHAAIDARLVRHNTLIAGASVIALLPPMTGG